MSNAKLFLTSYFVFQFCSKKTEKGKQAGVHPMHGRRAFCCCLVSRTGAGVMTQVCDRPSHCGMLSRLCGVTATLGGRGTEVSRGSIWCVLQG